MGAVRGPFVRRREMKQVSESLSLANGSAVPRGTKPGVQSPQPSGLQEKDRFSTAAPCRTGPECYLTPSHHLPPEGLGVRLASAGPFFFFAKSFSLDGAAVFKAAAMVIATALLTSPLLLGGCATSAGTDRTAPPPASAPSEPAPPPVAPVPPVAAVSPAPAAPPTPPAPAAPSWVQLSPTLRVDAGGGQVEADAVVALDAGFLEQVACKAGTREHESLLVPADLPSRIHAALLMAGLEPGAPGEWHQAEDGSVQATPPRGPRVRVLIRLPDGTEVPASSWVRDARSGKQLPDVPFVFAGSAFRPNPPSMGPGEHYVADWTGSVVGLVTFGDEVVAAAEVIPDQAGVAEPVWVAWTERIPRPGTRVTLILRAADR